MKDKKPTMMEVKNAINNLIQDIVSLDQKITAIDRILNMYVSFQGNEKEFRKHIEDELKKLQKKGDDDVAV